MLESFQLADEELFGCFAVDFLVQVCEDLMTGQKKGLWDNYGHK